MYLAVVVSLLASCQQQPDVCHIETIRVEQPRVEKTNLKSDIEFISIAYYDLLHKQITNTELDKLYKTFLAVGDKVLIGQVILNSLINEMPPDQIPSDETMRNNVDGFIIATYNRFYKRPPNEFELWQMRETINNDPELEPIDLYYAFVCSEEYKYF